jgi:hypothetical protein
MRCGEEGVFASNRFAQYVLARRARLNASTCIFINQTCLGPYFGYSFFTFFLRGRPNHGFSVFFGRNCGGPTFRLSIFDDLICG